VRIMRLDDAAVGQRLIFDLVDQGGRVLLRAGAELTPRYVELLRRRGYLSVPVHDPLARDVEPTEPLTRELRQRVTEVTQEAVRRAAQGSLAVTPALRAVVGEIVGALQRTPMLTYNLLSLHSLDTHFFVHSVNVCVYSVLVAGALALDPVDLRHLGVGAILHDIGMVFYRDLVEKPGQLTPEEMEKIRHHTDEGFELLRRQTEVDLRSAHVAYQHHERLDGSGYPRGLAGDRIAPWAKVVAIAEVFDSVTSSRTYAPTLSVAEALDLLEAEASAGRLDAYLVRYFVQRMSRYPAGTIVRLGDGAVGLVVQADVPGLSPARVRVVSADGARLLPTPYHLDADGREPGTTVAASLPDYPEPLLGEVVRLSRADREG
jgi:HD-GYP domain-containing protein (c-di-GMP phosphodiesterase class II)